MVITVLTANTKEKKIKSPDHSMERNSARQQRCPGGARLSQAVTFYWPIQLPSLRYGKESVVWMYAVNIAHQTPKNWKNENKITTGINTTKPLFFSLALTPWDTEKYAKYKKRSSYQKTQRITENGPKKIGFSGTKIGSGPIRG